MQEVFENVKKILKERGIWFEVKEHAPVYTSEEASRIRQVPLRWGVKAMVLKKPGQNEKACQVVGEFVLALVRADEIGGFAPYNPLGSGSLPRHALRA